MCNSRSRYVSRCFIFSLDKIDSAPPYALEYISSSVELDVEQVYVVNSGEYKDIVSDTSVYVEGFSPELTEARFFYSDENGNTFEVKKNDGQSFTKEDIKNWNNLLEQYETNVVDNKSFVTEFKEGRRRGIIELYVLFVIIISVIPVCVYCLLNKKKQNKEIYMDKKSKIVIHIIMLFVVIILAVVVIFAMIDKVRNNDSLNDTFIFNEEVSLNTNLFYSERLGEYIDFETVQGNMHLYAVEIDQDANEADITMIWVKDEGREIITSTVLSAPGERFTSEEITNWDEITEKYEQVHNKIDREYEANVRSVVLVVLLFALPAIMIIVIRIILIIKSNRKKLTND